MIILDDIERLILAYRKAKVDLYYSSHADLTALANYETNLKQNLQSLLDKINGQDESWIEQLEFLGGWKLIPTSITMPSVEEGDELHFSSKEEQWGSKNAFDHFSVRPVAQLRVMSNCSIDFHVLSTLWIMEVGHKIDEKLSLSSYGQRLRRTRSDNEFSELSLGSFQPYLKPFKEWRDSGLDAIKNQLELNKNLIAITADADSFFHNLNAAFIEDEAFLRENLEIDLDERESKINRLFVRGVQSWSRNSPLGKGLPVGLPASAIIANAALHELDTAIQREIAPIHYGRYVDDIILVIENKSDFRTQTQVWDWIIRRLGGVLRRSDYTHNTLEIQTYYLTNSGSSISFSNSKNKVFSLSGNTGRSLIEAIRRKISERSSLWRSMPNLPEMPERAASELKFSSTENGGQTDSLRAASNLSIARADFSMKLRDIEAYERDLSPSAWQSQREAFLTSFIDHVMVLPDFFSHAGYLPRVVKIATACEDFEILKLIFDKLGEIIDSVNRSCTLEIKGTNQQYSSSFSQPPSARWETWLASSFWSGVYSAFPMKLTTAGVESWSRTFTGDSFYTVEALSNWRDHLFRADLAHIPARFAYLPNDTLSNHKIEAVGSQLLDNEIANSLPESVRSGQEILSTKWLNEPFLKPELVFATRPFSISELSLISGNQERIFEEDTTQLHQVILSIRGFTPTGKMPYISENTLYVQDSSHPLNCGVAVSSWKTSMTDWVKAIVQDTSDDFARYNRFNRFIDRVLNDPAECKYLVLPELALPPSWFIPAARKLHTKRISLISGVEYRHLENGVQNQVWAALSHDGIGFSTFSIYKQDKQTPAIHEERELHRIANLKLTPENEWPSGGPPPIIQHGKFKFAILICSELTNIRYRSSLAGNIDALFVPAWNQDTDTFDALVESAALDLHAYIIQSNDRSYGDSRIRGPLKKSWKRDIVRAKGGVSDYSIIGNIDVVGLRQFQSNHRSPSGPFKPTPDGFEICKNRKMTPNPT